MALKIYVLKNTSTVEGATAEPGTTTTKVVINGHPLQTGELIINETRNALDKPASRIVTKLNDNEFELNSAIDGQTDGDTIRFFTYVEITQLLKTNTLHIYNREERSHCTFRLEISDIGDIVKTGQQIKIEYNGNIVFGGAIMSAHARVVGNASNRRLSVRVSSEGYNHVPARRTITENEQFDVKSGVIVAGLVDNFLHQEGITKGTIVDGHTWDEYPTDTTSIAVSIKTILDEMAAVSAARWYINNERELNFVDAENFVAEVTISESDIEDPESFEIEESLVDYRNKQFVIGGEDDFFGTVFVFRENVPEIQSRQLLEGGSGVYGNFLENTNDEDTVLADAEAGTTTTNITISNHGLVVGDMITNVTRDVARRSVTAVIDINNVTVDTITGQTEGDEILVYPSANKKARKQLRRFGSTTPVTINFRTHKLDILPQTKLTFNFTLFGMLGGAYLVEEVELYDLNGKELRSRITCVSRDASDFETKATDTWVEDFAKLKGTTKKDQIERLTETEADALTTYPRDKYFEIVDETLDELKTLVDTDVDDATKLATEINKINDILKKYELAKEVI